MKEKQDPRARRRTATELRQSLNPIALFVRERRKKLGYSQEVSLGFLKALELGKQSVRMDKVNQVLALFGARLEPHDAPRDDEK
jgi:hypothetical protein